MILYVLIAKDSGDIIRDQKGNILVFCDAPKTRSISYNILAIREEEINEIIYNENLDKDGIQN
jgi:hypothetical protein